MSISDDTHRDGPVLPDPPLDPAVEPATGPSGDPALADPAFAGSATEPAAGDGLPIADGTITVSATVVAKIAALAAQEAPGIHALGVGAARSVTSVRDRIPGHGPSAITGVSVEVGRTQAAVDLDVVVEYGIPITQIARDVRRRVVMAVEQLTGLQVVEVNITVDDVNLPPLSDPQGKQLQ